jgi:hypothetical protein
MDLNFFLPPAQLGVVCGEGMDEGMFVSLLV